MDHYAFHVILDFDVGRNLRVVGEKSGKTGDLVQPRGRPK